MKIEPIKDQNLCFYTKGLLDEIKQNCEQHEKLGVLKEKVRKDALTTGLITGSLPCFVAALTGRSLPYSFSAALLAGGWKFGQMITTHFEFPKFTFIALSKRIVDTANDYKKDPKKADHQKIGKNLEIIGQTIRAYAESQDRADWSLVVAAMTIGTTTLLKEMQVISANANHFIATTHFFATGALILYHQMYYAKSLEKVTNKVEEAKSDLKKITKEITPQAKETIKNLHGIKS